MANPNDVSKIYRIEIPGIDGAIGKIQQLNQEFALLKAVKLEANKVLSANPADADNIQRQTRILAENEVALKKNTAERKIASREAEVLIKAAQQEAIAHTNTANAAKFAEGSYNQLYASFKALAAEYRNTSPNSPLFDEIKTKAIAAKQKVDEFNRSLSPDGTLVGEYKTGILNAFKSLGLDSVLKDQKAKIEAAIRDLTAKNEELARQFKESGKQGKDAFAGIEAQIAKNVETQNKLQGNLNQINTTLKGTGSIGSQVTHAIGDGFSQIIKTGLAVLGISFGLHEAFEFLKDSIKEFAEADRIAKQFEGTLDNLGKSEALAGIQVQIESLHEKFKFLNESDLTQAASKLVDFGRLTKNQINELLPIIVNFASKQRITVQEATEKIISALEGSGKSLQQFGIRLSQNSTFAERLNIVMTTVKQKVEGAAEAFEKSSGGPIADTTEQIRELHEETGKKLIPIFNDLITVWEKVKSGLVDTATGIGTFILKLRAAAGDVSAIISLVNKAAEDQQELIHGVAKSDVSKFSDSTVQEIGDEINKVNAVILQKQTLINGFDRLKRAGVIITKEDEERAKTGLQLLKEEADLLRKLQDSKANGDTVIGVGGSNEDEARRARLKQIAEIENASIKQQIVLEQRREKGKVSERQYQQDLYDILSNAEKRKMEVLTKGSTEEIKQANQIQLQLLKDRQTFLDKMFNLDKQSVEARKTVAIQNAQNELDAVLNNPLSTGLQKANAQIAFDQKRLDIEQIFANSMDKLEVQYAKKSEKNEADRNKAINEIIQKSLKDRFDLVQANLNDIDHQTAVRLAGITQQFDILKENVLNGKGNRFQKSSRLVTLDDIENIALLTQQLEGDTEKAKAAKEAFDAGKITYEQYAAAVDKATQSHLRLQQALDKNKVSAANLKELLQNSIGDSLGFDTNSDLGRSQRQLLGQTIVDTFQTAGNAMNTYFDMEQNRINASNKLTKQRLDIELNQQKARAQSQAERDALDREFQKKKDAADKEAFEKSKKIQIAQAEINLGIQLSNLAVIAFSPNPLNIATLGTAGAIMFAIQAALAIVNFALNVSKIKSATYEKGGQLGDVLGKGGEFGGQPHSRGGNKFMFGSVPVETEAGEAYVINKNATQSKGRFTVTGTPRQIASAINTIGGGRPFDSGAIMYRGFEYGGMMGDNLKAPINPSSFLNPSSQGNSFEEIKNMIAITHNSLVQTNRRIDNIKVYQVTREVEGALNKKVKNDKVNSL